MPSQNLPAPPVGGGLKALKNISTQSHCETPNRPYLKAEDNDKKTVYFIRPDCKQWSCPPCAARRAAIWRHLASYGGDCLLEQGLGLSFVTLTSHEVVRSVTAGVAVWRKSWPKLSARWRRKSPGAQYFYVGEQKKAMNFHVHMVTSADIQTRWYKDNARACGLGYEAKAVPVLTGVEAGGYCTKYLTKAIAVQGWPKYWRRINKSQKWPTPPEPKTPYEWAALGYDLVRVQYSVYTYARAGWRVEHSLNELDVSQ